MKKTKKIFLIIGIIIMIPVVTVVIALAAEYMRTESLINDYSSIYEDSKYSKALYVEGVEVIKQDVSCGYAVIEMFSNWNGGHITEESLFSEHGKVVTSTGKSFCAEMNKQFPQYRTTIHKNLKNTEMIDLIYENLSEGIPVPFEWAALCDGEWTLHYSLVTGADIPGNKITAANPYGYYEELSIEDFLSRTSFEAYDNMPFFIKLGFAFGIFEKNTVFSVQ